MKPTPKLVLLLFSVTLLSLTAASSSRVQPELLAQEQLSATQILSRVAQVYANCKSYRDSGTARLTFKTVNAELQFTTAFVRPGRFRYECLEKSKLPHGKDNQYIIWRKDKDVDYWWSFEPEHEKPVSFSMAIARATGVTQGTAHITPVLLFPEKEVGGRRTTDLTDAERLDDASLDGIRCLRVQGRQSLFRVSLWIDKETYLIRRIENISDFGHETTIDYKPLLDAEIPDAELEFNPPR